MATLSFTSSLFSLNKNPSFNHTHLFIQKKNPTHLTKHHHPFGPQPNLSFFSISLKSRTRVRFSAQDEQESSEPSKLSSSSVASVVERPNRDELSVEDEESEQQELDWKSDEEFKKFMGNPSIEAAIKLERKRADRKLKELDRESSSNPVVGFFKRVVRENLTKEKEWLEKAEEKFKVLDLNKLKNCFGFDTFFATDVRIFGDGGIFIGNLRKPIEEVIPKLEKKLSEAEGREVVLWFMEEKNNDITKQINDHRR